ncbi:MAG: rRNA adenine dimethyltransferase family protein, partial [bacterium]|nr:rRNA adenine dimethyltransferase family protein [bacterium]
EVVDRMAANPGTRDFGRLTVMLQYRFSIETLFDVAADAFDPPPKVVSAVVRLVPRAASDMDALDLGLLENVVATAFGQRRKTLRNTLGSLLSADDFNQLDIDPTRRAETLAVADFVRIANHIYRKEAP